MDDIASLFFTDNETSLAYAVVMQPIQVAVDASHTSFQLYKSGIYDEPECSTTRLDHTMLLVGYGTTDDGQAYWILKNTWGQLYLMCCCTNMGRSATLLIIIDVTWNVGLDLISVFFLRFYKAIM